MSDHQKGSNEHEPWKANLSHAFKDLKAADNDRDARLRYNQEEIQRIISDVFPPVFAQFVRDAKEHGFHAAVSPQPNNRQRLTLEGASSCQIDFWTEATPDAARVFAQRHHVPPIDLLAKMSPSQFHQANFGDYLVTQLESIKPKKQ